MKATKSSFQNDCSFTILDTHTDLDTLRVAGFVTIGHNVFFVYP
jgi:hypothetical protein